MRDYSPKRRTALVLAGTGVAGAYHAGVLRALDECGVKIDLVVGSGAGTVAAAYAAVAGGARLYGKGSFWDGADWRTFFTLRPALRVARILLSLSFAFFLLPLGLAVIGGLLFPIILLLDLAVPGVTARAISALALAPEVLRGPFAVALTAPVFILAGLAAAWLIVLVVKKRWRAIEAFEAFLDATPGLSRLRRGLWQIARGAALHRVLPAEEELGARYVALASENLEQPGFRELVVRTADLETGAVLSFVLLADEHRAGSAASPTRDNRGMVDGVPGVVDLRMPGYASMFFDAVATGILPPVGTPVRRIVFPRRGLHPGETHRIADATLAGGCGIREALAAGAEQVIVVSVAPEEAGPLPRRRGPKAFVDAALAALERQAVEQELSVTERTNRMIDTLGHVTPKGDRAWQDPATGRHYRSVATYPIRPRRRLLGPLELNGARDPATEALTTPADLLEMGYRDALKQFVEPVVGAVPETSPPRPPENADNRPTVEL